MYKFRGSKEYENGLDKLLDIAFEKESVNGKIVCPCKNCKLGDWVDRVTAKDHLTYHGFLNGYARWFVHGEASSSTRPTYDLGDNFGNGNDMQGILHDGICFGRVEITVMTMMGMVFQEMRNQIMMQNVFMSC